jgi:hypothetical protein
MLSTQPANAHTTQPRWNTCTVTYAINYMNINKPKAEHRKVKKALRAISKHTKIKFIYNGSTQYMPIAQPKTQPPANIVIAYPKRNQSDLYNHTGGLANYFYDHNNHMVHASITIAPPYANNKGYYSLYLHELIHTIGYNQHIEDPTSIMNPIVYAKKLSQADKKMLETIGREMRCRK